MGCMKAAGERLAVRMRALGQPWELVVFLCMPFLLFTVVLAADVHFRGSSLGDWEIFRGAAKSALHGHSPYPAADPSALARGFRLSTELVAGVLAGAGIGWVLDRWLGISPWGMIVFLLLGFAAGVLNVMRVAGVVPANTLDPPGSKQ